jgi:hypothetical protein
MTLEITLKNATFSIMALNITTLSIMMLKIKTLSIAFQKTTFSIMTLNHLENAKLSITMLSI